MTSSPSAFLIDAAIEPHPDRLDAVEQAWVSLVGPGPTLSMAERHEVVQRSRDAWVGGDPPNPGEHPLAEAAHWVAVDAEGLNEKFVGDLERRGLDRLRYLEVVGIVGRLANIDWYARGLGATVPALDHLPGPGPGAKTPSGEPTGEVHPEARIMDGWVPATGPLQIVPFVLDALPSEGRALRRILQPMYVPFGHLTDATYVDAISKPQIEYLAARTSYLNECFYSLLAHTGFLRASSNELGIDFDYSVVASGATPVLKAGEELAALVQRMGTDRLNPPTAEREALAVALNERAAERAIGVVAALQMLNRLLDGIGAPVGQRAHFHSIARLLDFQVADLPR